MNSEGVLAADTDEPRRPDLAGAATTGAAAFLSLLAAIRYGVRAETAVLIFSICVLVVISRIDLQRRIIPNRIVLPAWLVVLAANLALHPAHWLAWLAWSFGAGLFFLLVALAYPAGLGMGDVKLALFIGAVLGSAAAPALFLGTLAAGIAGAILIFKEGSSARKRGIPLGPFLAGGAIVVLLLL